MGNETGASRAGGLCGSSLKQLQQGETACAAPDDARTKLHSVGSASLQPPGRTKFLFRLFDKQPLYGRATHNRLVAQPG